MYKRVIYSSTLQGDVYITAYKILAAIYNIYINEIRKCCITESAQNNFEILETFTALTHRIKTEYNFDKNEFGDLENLVSLSESFELEEYLIKLFNLLPQNSFEIEIIEDNELTLEQHQCVRRLFIKYIHFTFSNSEL